MLQPKQRGSAGPAVKVIDFASVDQPASHSGTATKQRHQKSFECAAAKVRCPNVLNLHVVGIEEIDGQRRFAIEVLLAVQSHVGHFHPVGARLTVNHRPSIRHDPIPLQHRDIFASAAEF